MKYKYIFWYVIIIWLSMIFIMAIDYFKIADFPSIVIFMPLTISIIILGLAHDVLYFINGEGKRKISNKKEKKNV